MARLRKGILFTATIGDICFYQRYGRTYTRQKSTLTTERVLKDKEFEKTRQYANNFAIAAQIASPIYKALPADTRARWIYRTIAGHAASLLYKGKTTEQVNNILWKKYIHNQKANEEKAIAAGRAFSNKDTTTSPNSNTTENIEKPKKSLKAVLEKRWRRQGKRKKDFILK